MKVNTYSEVPEGPEKGNLAERRAHKVTGPNLKQRWAAGLPKDMKKLLTSILVLVAFLLAFTTLGIAASDSATVSVSWTVKAQQSLKIVSTNPSLSSSSSSSTSVTSVLDVPEPNDEDIGSHIQKNDALKLEASSNTPWKVQVEAENSFLRSTNGYVDLSVRAQNGFEQVSTDPTTIARGQPGTHELGVDYRFNYDEDYESGDYEIKLTYTITTP